MEAKAGFYQVGFLLAMRYLVKTRTSLTSFVFTFNVLLTAF